MQKQQHSIGIRAEQLEHGTPVYGAVVLADLSQALGYHSPMRTLALIAPVHMLQLETKLAMLLLQTMQP